MLAFENIVYLAFSEDLNNSVGRFDAIERAAGIAKRRENCRECSSSCRMPYIKDLTHEVDLRTSDEFGRNVLYYASLCGHVRVAHFVVVHAYGDVQVGLPRTVLREKETRTFVLENLPMD